MDVSIIIVNYNTTQLLINCIESIIKCTNNLVYEIIVVDNNSKEKPQNIIFNMYPEVIYVQSEINLGFGKANNLGVKNANGEFVFLLNSDTILINNAIWELHNFYNKNNHLNIGALGGNLFDKLGNPNFSYSIYFPSLINIILYRSRIFRFFKLESFNKSNQYKIVSIIIGADLFIKKELFEKIGGFDPNIFMYIEDGDLQFQIKKLNLKIINVPTAQITHLQGSSSSSFDRLKMEVTSYNYYFKKNHSILYSKIYLIIEVIFTCITVLFAVSTRSKMLKSNYNNLLKFIIDDLLFT
jgi:hypothetical protein